MKFVYLGYDFMLPAIRRLVDEGHELTGIFSFDCDNIFNFNQACQELAQREEAPFILSKIEDFHIQKFIQEGTEVFLSAGYPYKIPEIDEKSCYGVNVHPTYLPKARGIMPIPKIILDNMQEAAGFSAHKITSEFDQGDILLQLKFPLDKQETVETYGSKIAMRAPDAFSELLANLANLWANASKQNNKKATFIKPPQEEERVFDWNLKVKDIDRIGRAFGRFGSLADFDGRRWVVTNYDYWEEKHARKPGEIAAILSREVTIAAKDGFICLKDFQPLDNN